MNVSEPAIGRARRVAEGPLIALASLACGLLVANIYLAQTLVGPIARDLGIERSFAGFIVTLTQLGYALGLAFVVPLADSLENKRLAIVAASVALAGLIGVACAHAPATFLLASLCVGVGSTGAQVLLPMTTHFVAPERAGRTIGLVMSGLLGGIMLSRPFASFVASAFGWRATFALAAALTLVTIGLLLALLPTRVPETRTRYATILRSMSALIRTEPTLRVRASYQALLFVAFNIFWTAAPLVLAQRFGFDQRAIALFALAGAGGALAAPLAGRLADRGLGEAATLAAFLATTIAFALSGWFVALGATVAFAFAAIVLDAAVQTNQVVGQRIVYALSREARGRVNAIYLTSIFLVGATGPALGGWLFARFAWDGVVVAGAALGLVLVVLRWSFASRARPAGRQAGT